MGSKAYPWIGLVLILIFCTSFSQANITYTVVSPKLIQPFATVRAVLFISRISDWSNFSASIVHNGTAIYTSDVVVTNATHPPRVLIIPTEDLPEISYSLVFNAVCGDQSFTDHTTVFTVTKNRSILIQTDKTIYQPGEIFRFRVLILNRNLKLLSVTPTADINVYDSEKILIKRWSNVTISKGLFSGKIQLSTETNLGTWKVDVISGARKESRTFSVIKSILPKLKLELKLPPYITFNSSSFVVQIKADYNFGKPISGVCAVSLRYYYAYDPITTASGRAILKTIPIKGVAFVQFDLRKDFDITKYSGDEDFQITARVTEGIGSLFEEVSEIITMYKYPYKLEMLTERETYTPGFPLTVTIKVTEQDGTPISDSNPQAVKVTHGFTYYAEGSVLYSSLPSNGLVNFTFQTPTNEYLTISNIDVTYKELTQWFPPPKKASSSSSIYLHISILSESPTAGRDLEFMVQSNKMFAHVIYLLISRGRILLFDKILLNTTMNETRLTISLPTTANPTAVLLIASIFPPNHVFVVNSLKFPVAPKIENYVKIISSDSCIEPGNNITLQIETSPESLVALRAVDQSVLKFKDDLDITMDKLQIELLSYEDEIMNRKDWTTLQAYEIFEDAGLIIMTNFHIVKTQLNSFRYMLHEAPMVLARLAIESKRPEKRDEENTKLFRKPPETWFFEEILTETGNTTFVTQVPETLTSWIITGYSLSNNVPIGVTKSPTKFKTYRQFFISTAIPPCVVEGEVMALQLLVHNYLDMNITAEITMDNSDLKYDFIYSLFKGVQTVTKTVNVSAQEVSFIQFMVKYITVGVTELKVKAVVPGVAGDTLTKLIVVKPNGIVQKKTISLFVSTTPTNPLAENNFNVSFPELRVPGLDKLTIVVIGDILQLTTGHIDTLISQYTSGAQTLFGFSLDTVILKYLKATERLTPKLEEKLVGFLETGYQRELTYHRDDGSFSAFGNEDFSGSSWLTAAFVRTLLASKKFITIDNKLITSSILYLSQMQTENGTFTEEGDVLYSDNGIANDAVITSYITLTLLEALKLAQLDELQKSDLEKVVELALAYISSINLEEHTAHSINVITFCLHKANHTEKDVFFDKMEKLATKNSNDEKYWKFRVDTTDSDNTDNINYSPKPHEIETTSYAMLTYIVRGMINEAIPIFKWLVKQMNPYGGFLSNQDTIVGLRALSEITEILRNDDPDVDIVVQYNNDERDEFKVQRDNTQDLQEKQLPNTVSSVSIRASGNGTALVQLITSYFIAEELQNPIFEINIAVTDVENQGKIMGLFVCGRYTGVAESNMVLMDITLPTGYAFNSYSLRDLKSIPKLMHYVASEDHTILSMYFSFLQTNNSVCVDLNINTQYMVMNHAPGRVIMYDYYDDSIKTIQMYRAPLVDICKICNADYLCKVDDCD